METKWTYEVLLHDMYGAASYWYRDYDARTGKPCAFTNDNSAIVRGRELYPNHEVRATIFIDR